MNPEAIVLAKRFEPILLFHPDETFFPIDPKLYLERSALWRSKPHVRNFFPGGAAAEKQDWGEPPPTIFPRKPKLAKGQIAALKKEAMTGGKTWIGDPSLGAVIPEPPTERPPGEDWFLQLTGWEPFVAAPDEVTATSNNRRPTLGANVYDGALLGGRPWYYAEYLDNQELFALVRNRPDLFPVVNNARLSQPRLLVYHFFYALHEEPLRGCETAGEGQTFATFGGEWASVALLINSAREPLYIGLTSRNVGDPSSILAEENRIGMIAEPWSKVDRVGDHPKIFVSRGTHGNYLTMGPHPLKPFTPGDIDLNQGTCSEIEKLDDVISGGESNLGSSEYSPAISSEVVWGGLALNLFLGLFLEMINIMDRKPSLFIPAIEPDRTPQDETGGPLFGLILRPEKLFLANEQATAKRIEDWQTKMPETADEPRYDCIVDRETQAWWPPRETSLGYAGRWGPRVTNDPKQRRSGMRCPPFALLFLEGIAKLP